MIPQQEVVLDGELSLELNLDGDVSLDLQMDGTADKVIRVSDFMYPIYEGVTEITPSDHPQILSTTNTTVVQDIVVGPIPPNYGLITWNGSTLTVS